MISIFRKPAPQQMLDHAEADQDARDAERFAWYFTIYVPANLRIALSLDDWRTFIAAQSAQPEQEGK